MALKNPPPPPAYTIKIGLSKCFKDMYTAKSSRGGLVVERLLSNSSWKCTLSRWIESHRVWCINRSVEETLRHNSNCRTPGPLGGL